MMLSKLFTTMLLLVAIPCLAEVYKWKDADGNVHYSESAPAEATEIETIKLPKAVKDPSIENQSTSAKPKPTGQQVKTKKVPAPDPVEQQRRCAQARKSLISFQRPRIRVTEKDGSIRIIGEEERQQHIAELQKRVAELCQN